MSKSLGNTYTIAQLEEMGYSALAFRYFCLNTHYRKKLNFTFEGLKAAQVAYTRMLNALYEHKISATATAPEVIEKYRKDFIDAVNDDINIPLSLGVIWTMLKETPSKDIYALALEFDKVLGLSLNKAKPAEKEKIEVPDSIKAIADERWQARLAKNWAESDRLRDELANLGYLVKDAKDGYTLEKK
jgi:cysteinyl-tRNA synthetase